MCIISILIIIFVLSSIFLAGIFYFKNEINSNVTSNNITYSYEKVGHVGNDIIWYIDNIKYEINASDYGYNINDYEAGTDFRIYLDDNHYVVDISPIIKGEITPSDKNILHVVF